MGKRKTLTSEASRRGRANRNKGKVFEREVANAFKRVYPGARRGVGQARDGAERPDVIGTPFWIEAGVGSTIKIHDKLRQGHNDAAVSNDEVYAGVPVVVLSKSVRGEALATMEMEAFIDLLAEFESLRRNKANALRPTRSAP